MNSPALVLFVYDLLSRLYPPHCGAVCPIRLKTLITAHELRKLSSGQRLTTATARSQDRFSPSVLSLAAGPERFNVHSLGQAA